jgi:hypothetical protein
VTGAGSHVAVRPATPPEPGAAPAAASAGLPGIDLLRLFAVCAIAWFHAGGPLSEYLGFRLPTVALVTSLVLSRSARWRPRGVLVPWAIWYAVYLAALLVRVAGSGSAVDPDLRWYHVVLSGPAPHLWYAPFALMTGHLVQRFAGAATIPLLAGVAATSLAAVGLKDLSYPGPQWGMVLPAIPGGMLMARKETPRAALLALAAMTIGALGMRYGIAIALVYLVSRWEGPRFGRLSEIGRGVYWGHVLVILFLHKLGLANPALAVLGSGAAALALSRTPWGRRAL